jgi:hypothetical protein
MKLVQMLGLMSLKYCPSTPCYLDRNSFLTLRYARFCSREETAQRIRTGMSHNLRSPYERSGLGNVRIRPSSLHSFP